MREAPDLMGIAAVQRRCQQSFLLFSIREGKVTYSNVMPDRLNAKVNTIKRSTGGKFAITLFDDSTITLIANSVGIKEDYEYGTWFFPSAKLSEANYKKITQAGVKKIRFETFPQVFDVEYKEDIIGEFLKEATPILKEKINSGTDRMTKGF